MDDIINHFYRDFINKLLIVRKKARENSFILQDVDLLCDVSWFVGILQGLEKININKIFTYNILIEKYKEVYIQNLDKRIK